MLILRRAPATATPSTPLDDSQRAVLESSARVRRVLGGPGTGKTTLAVELIARQVAAGERADRCLALTSSRAAAAALRDRVTARLGGTSTQPLARTWQAFGFALLRSEAALRGDPAPRLLSGPEQDVVLRDLLAGHAAGDAPGPEWPEALRAALGTRGFRAELRDLLMRAVEHGLGPDDLVVLGKERDRPEWVAAAHLLREYDQVTAFSRYGAYDPAWVLTAAADRLDEDGRALDRLREAISLVVVDDAQELTSAAARLLAVVGSAGPRIVLLGDPDAAVQTFRGADPGFLAHGWVGLGREEDRESHVLRDSYRVPAALREVIDRVVRRIGALGGGAQREWRATRPGGLLEVALLRSAAQEASHVAGILRRAHLVDAVPWDEMAVIVRGAARAGLLRRLLATAGVPLASATAETPVRDEIAVRPLLAILRVALAVASARCHGSAAALDPRVAADLVTSPIGGADPVALRRLRRLLRREELEAGGGRSSDELLAGLLLDPVRARSLGEPAAPAARIAAAIDAGARAARVTGSGGRDRVATAETVLWEVWAATGLAGPWRRAALAGGAAGSRADRDLDAVLGLFDAAAAFVDRLPQAGPDAFLDHVEGQDVPGDTLLARAQSGPAVQLLTPQTAAGRQWRIVVVAGVQEGVWPDLRLRGSVLGSEELVDVVTGRPHSFRAAQTAVRYDETRLLHVALTRTTERLVVTAVGNEDEQPSVYLDLVDPPAGDGLDTEVRRHTHPHRPMTLTGLVGELRRDVANTDPAVARPAAVLLAHAARGGVAGAHPQSWWALRELSDDRAVRPPDEPVLVSPSKVERFRQCGLSWFLSAVGGNGPARSSQLVGTLVHDIAADQPEAESAVLHAELDRRWGRLGLGPGWLTERARDEAHDMIARFVAYRADAAASGWRQVAVEAGFTVQIDRARLKGRVDRIEQDRAGRLRIVDLKTGGTKPSGAELAEHGQLGAYQAAVESGAFAELGTTSGGAALVQLGKAGLSGRRPAVQGQSPLAEAADPRWAGRLVAETAAGMGAATFRAVQGSWCQLCPVRTSCPVQPEGEAL